VESLHWPTKWNWKVAGWGFFRTEWAMENRNDERERQAHPVQDPNWDGDDDLQK
jgi:hypothetical protein